MSGPVKFIALLKARTDIDRDAFKAYYEQKHVPLIARTFPGMVSYRRNFVTCDLMSGQPAPDDFDVITEIVFRDRAAFDQTMAMGQQDPVGPMIAADEEQFLDRSRSRYLLVEESVTNRSDDMA